jgi:hypothetical protein
MAATGAAPRKEILPDAARPLGAGEAANEADDAAAEEAAREEEALSEKAMVRCVRWDGGGVCEVFDGGLDWIG